MELKHKILEVGESAPTLLIVPYGIETLTLKCITRGLILLIVPYGIETGLQEAEIWHIQELLIVPYGIETKKIRS